MSCHGIVMIIIRYLRHMSDMMRSYSGSVMVMPTNSIKNVTIITNLDIHPSKINQLPKYASPVIQMNHVTIVLMKRG